MEFEYIEHRKGLPYKLFLVSIGHRSHHFHAEMEIIYVYRGSISIQVKQEMHHLKIGDLFLIHPYEIHSINDTSEAHAQRYVRQALHGLLRYSF